MTDSAPSLTVVCNVYDDADRLPRAVASVLAGWDADLSDSTDSTDSPDATATVRKVEEVEVVIVDDGSTDDTLAVAHALAQADPRVRVVHREVNDGAPGAPRNLGLAAARGHYVAFVDSDDVYLPGALPRLLGRALAADADVAAGAVSRWNPRTGVETSLAATGYTAGPVGPLDADSPLWMDTIAVAKVIRRSLLEDQGIRFPEGILYEDQPFTLRVWLAARSVVTLDEVVYHWFVTNEEGDQSITARRHEIDNFADRLTANRLIDAALADLTDREDLAAAKLRKFVEHDLSLYGKDLDRRDPAYLTGFRGLARDYLASVPPERRAALAQPHRLVVRELVDGSDESVVAASLFAYRRLHVERPLALRSGRWWWPHPAGSTSPDHDLTALVQARAAKGRHVRTTRAVALRADGPRLALELAVVDGDGSLPSRATVAVELIDRSSGKVLTSASTRVSADRIEAVVDLAPVLASTGPTDLKVAFGGRLRRPPSSAYRYAVELPPTSGLALSVAGPDGRSTQAYRTRNGNLSLRAAAH